jgi:AcrR family transcriptional regulator
MAQGPATRLTTRHRLDGADKAKVPALPAPERELRADAQRNLARILEAAREVFAEEGIDARVTEIAARAGVGVGTIFRRFPNKDELIVALLEQRGRQLGESADAALAGDDPGLAFRRLIEQGVEMQIMDRGLCDAIGTDLLARDELRAQFDLVHAKLDAVLRRAQEAGAVRADATAEDLLFVVHGVAHAGLMLEDTAPGAWRRHLGLALDGLRPEAATPLPRKPLTRRQFQAARCGG